MRLLAALSLVLTSSLFVGACGSEPESGKLRIAVIPKGTTHEYWKAVHAGAELAARELDVEILWKGPLKEDDRTAQIQVVEDFVVRGVDAIVLMPLDDQALVAPAKDAAGRGIPVVVADSDLAWEGRASFVATDNERGGMMGAETLADLLGGEGKVVMLRYLEGSASTAARERGFLKAIGAHAGIEVISKNQYTGATVEGAYQTSENVLNSFEKIDGIFCPNESAAFGMLRALEDSGRVDSVAFVGFDSSEKLLEGLASQKIDALVLQDPVKMGELAVRAAVDAARGNPVEGRIDTGVVVASPANLASPEIQALLAPDLSILED